MHLGNSCQKCCSELVCGFIVRIMKLHFWRLPTFILQVICVNICTSPCSLFLKYLYLFLMIAGDIVLLSTGISVQRTSMTQLTQLAMGISTSDWISIQTDMRIQNFYKLQFSDLLTYYWTLWSEVRSLSKVVKSCHRKDNRVRGSSPPSDLCCHSWG